MTAPNMNVSSKFRQAATECLFQARELKDPQTRYNVVLMAQFLFEAACTAAALQKIEATPPRLRKQK